MKKGRENNQFLPRKFVLSEIENTIKYYVKVSYCMISRARIIPPDNSVIISLIIPLIIPVQDRKDPKAVIKISDINVAFSPTKIPFPNSLQIDYLKVSLSVKFHLATCPT